MDNEPRGGDDLPDQAELSGPVRDAIEQIRRQEPAEAMLARVLERARQIAASPQSNPTIVSAATGTASGGGLKPTLPPAASPRRHRMFTFAIRGLAAAAAAAALIGAWLYNQVSSTAAADLGAVLTRTSAAESLELKVTQDGKTGEVWVRGRKLRRNLPDGTYQIARDGKAWLVDEKANRASLQARGTVPRRGRRRGPLGPARSSCGPPRRQAEGTAGGPAGRACDPRRPRGGNLSLGDRRAGRHAADRRRGGCQDPVARSRSKACGSAASGPSRSASWPSSPETNRSTKTCSSWAIR